MSRTLNLYSIFYYNIINIRVLIILKHFENLNFEYYKYMCVCCGERETGNFFKKRNGDLCVERER